VRATRVPAERAEVVRRQLAFEREPGAFVERFAAEDAGAAARIRRGRERLPAVRFPDALLARIAGACASLEVDGLRADIVTAKAAAALAALDGHEEVAGEQVRRAALLALGHRRRRGPLERPGIDPEELDRLLAEDPPPDGGGEPPDGAGPAPGGGNGAVPESERPAPPPVRGDGTPAGRGPAGRDAGSHGDAGEEPPGAAAPGGGRADSTAPPDRRDGEGDAPGTPGGEGSAPAAGTRTDAPAGAFTAPLVSLDGQGRGAAGRRSPARAEGGRPVGAERHRRGAGVAALATVRAAAPHQAARGRSGPGLVLAAGDLRSPLHDSREGNLVLFVVDASGSMAARRRMAAVKGAVLALLVDAYQRRDLVGLISFRGEGAEVLLPPTSSVEVAAERLSALPTGGRTPTAAGLDRARELIRVERVRDARRRALVFLVTDGRANAGGPPSAEPAHRAAPRAAERAAAALARDGAGLVVLDTEDGPARLGLAARLAAAGGAPCLRLQELEGERIAAVVRTSLGRAA
jgi:magnesium chelatase subunit D